MKNIWYYRFLGVVVFWVVSVNLQAQSDSLLQSSDMNLQVQSNDLLLNSDLKRKGFKLLPVKVNYQHRLRGGG